MNTPRLQLRAQEGNPLTSCLKDEDFRELSLFSTQIIHLSMAKSWRVA